MQVELSDQNLKKVIAYKASLVAQSPELRNLSLTAVANILISGMVEIEVKKGKTK